MLLVIIALILCFLCASFGIFIITKPDYLFITNNGKVESMDCSNNICSGIVRVNEGGNSSTVYFERLPAGVSVGSIIKVYLNMDTSTVRRSGTLYTSNPPPPKFIGFSLVLSAIIIFIATIAAIIINKV